MENQDKVYHFVGIKGSGMSSLALVLHEKGYHVQGSDVEEYFFTQRDLEKAGITLLPFDKENIQPEMVIIPRRNPSCEGIRVRNYALP